MDILNNLNFGVFRVISNLIKVYIDFSVKRFLNVSCKDVGIDFWISVDGLY